MLFVLLYYEPYTKWAFIFFPACSSSGCVWLYWPSWLSQWRWQMVENQRNKVTEHFLFYVTLTALYCQILLYFTLHCSIYNPRLVCIALCYFILPHMLLYITLSAHIALYYLSMHYIIPHYIHTISPHMPLYFPEFLCITPDLSKFPFSRLQYIIPLCSIFTPYGSISLIQLYITPYCFIGGFNGNNINKRYRACACLWPWLNFR